MTRNRLVERVIEKMTSVQQNPRPSEPPRPSQSTSIKTPAPTQPLDERRSSRTERPTSPEIGRNREYQSTINRLLSVIENKFLDIVILVDGSDSFNQINQGRRRWFLVTLHHGDPRQCATIHLCKR